MPLHRFAGTIRRNKHRDDRAHGRLQNPLAQNDVRAGEPSRRWEARWNKWKGQSIQPVIPNKENRKQPHAFDSKRYKNRNTIERMFGRPKDYRRIAMRYDKNADNFMAALCLAALICYWI